MISTYGLTHIALKVKDIARSLSFYQQVFGVRVMYQKADFAQVQTPGSKDIIVFEQSEFVQPNGGSIIHFGFRLVDPKDIEQLEDEVSTAGGTIKEKGEFVSGEPFAFVSDPDGYEIEVWFEKIPLELSSFS
ncbi:VOC family protein [Danxiaibacter flavus]|uniref:VOC family protein n=1 Tax=Danxiaibacter flavus TaxID=3049108 RepID=A0ABV3ZDW5_9BACT|nr:VOC family protein [Chitinophagaceae bacterium DXS]